MGSGQPGCMYYVCHVCIGDQFAYLSRVEPELNCRCKGSVAASHHYLSRNIPHHPMARLLMAINHHHLSSEALPTPVCFFLPSDIGTARASFRERRIFDVRWDVFLRSDAPVGEGVLVRASFMSTDLDILLVLDILVWGSSLNRPLINQSRADISTIQFTTSLNPLLSDHPSQLVMRAHTQYMPTPSVRTPTSKVPPSHHHLTNKQGSARPGPGQLLTNCLSPHTPLTPHARRLN